MFFIIKEVIVQPAKFAKENYKSFVLSVDIGGTHTRLAVLGIKSNKSFEQIFCQRYNTAAVSDISYNINDTLRATKEEYDVNINTAGLCVAGSVSIEREEIVLTNANLIVNKHNILSKTMLSNVALLNDFEAIAYGIDLLDMEKDVVVLSSTKNAKSRKGTCAIIGAGTGLGMSILGYDAIHDIHIPLASEGGHISLCPATDTEWDFYNYLKASVLQNKSEPDTEMAVSGQGIENIYNFIRQKKMFPQTDITKRIDSLTGSEKLHEIDISYGADETCRKTLDIFMTFYARAAKNLALVSECYGGFFICGKITMTLLEVIKKGIFVSEFLSHEKKAELLKKIPLYVIANKNIALYGSANFVLNYA